MADTPSLEDRVAALEMAADLSAFPSSWQSLTEAEKAGFIAAIAESRQRVRLRVLNAPLTPDEVRQLLRECVTVVKPGEHLILRVPWSTTPSQVRELQEVVNEMAGYLELPFRMLVLPGDELGVAEPGGIPDGT